MLKPLLNNWLPLWKSERKEANRHLHTSHDTAYFPPLPILFLAIFFEGEGGGRRGQTRCIMGDVRMANCFYCTKHKYRFKMKLFLISWWVHGNNKSRQSFCHSSLVNEKATGWLVVVLSVFFLFLLCMCCARFECQRNNFVTCFQPQS